MRVRRIALLLEPADDQVGGCADEATSAPKDGCKHGRKVVTSRWKAGRILAWMLLAKQGEGLGYAVCFMTQDDKASGQHLLWWPSGDGYGCTNTGTTAQPVGISKAQK